MSLDLSAHFVLHVYTCITGIRIILPLWPMMVTHWPKKRGAGFDHRYRQIHSGSNDQ